MAKRKQKRASKQSGYEQSKSAYLTLVAHAVAASVPPPPIPRKYSAFFQSEIQGRRVLEWAKSQKDFDIIVAAAEDDQFELVRAYAKRIIWANLEGIDPPRLSKNHRHWMQGKIQQFKSPLDWAKSLPEYKQLKAHTMDQIFSQERDINARILVNAFSSGEEIEKWRQLVRGLPIVSLGLIVEYYAHRRKETIIQKELDGFKLLLDTVAAVCRSKGAHSNEDLGLEPYFKWPSFAVSCFGQNGVFFPSEIKANGLLSLHGYHVGTSSQVSITQRQKILRSVYLDVPGDPRFETWGEVNSMLRLQRMAYTIAYLIHTRSGNQSGNYKQAIEDWKSDLEFLHDRFYVGIYDFQWRK